MNGDKEAKERTYTNIPTLRREIDASALDLRPRHRIAPLAQDVQVLIRRHPAVGTALLEVVLREGAVELGLGVGGYWDLAVGLGGAGGGDGHGAEREEEEGGDLHFLEVGWGSYGCDGMGEII